jgi:hypothetical protein
MVHKVLRRALHFTCSEHPCTSMLQFIHIAPELLASSHGVYTPCTLPTFGKGSHPRPSAQGLAAAPLLFFTTMCRPVRGVLHMTWVGPPQTPYRGPTKSTQTQPEVCHLRTARACVTNSGWDSEGVSRKHPALPHLRQARLLLLMKGGRTQPCYVLPASNKDGGSETTTAQPCRGLETATA